MTIRWDPEAVLGGFWVSGGQGPECRAGKAMEGSTGKKTRKELASAWVAWGLWVPGETGKKLLGLIWTWSYLPFGGWVFKSRIRATLFPACICGNKAPLTSRY